jgi:hypothetical protein
MLFLIKRGLTGAGMEASAGAVAGGGGGAGAGDDEGARAARTRAAVQRRGGRSAVGQPAGVQEYFSRVKTLSPGRWNQPGKRARYIYPPFSPGSWLKPGLKGGL